MTVNYKNVDVITSMPIRNLEKPLYGTTFDINLSINDILICILEKATVLERLPNGEKLKLTLNNYKDDNVLGEEPDDDGYNRNIHSFPFISNKLTDEDAPYLVTGNAIKQYLFDNAGIGEGLEISKIDGKTFKDSNGATIKIKRGLKIDLPALESGEFGLALDEKRVYVGGMSGSTISIPNAEDMTKINRSISDLENLVNNIEIPEIPESNYDAEAQAEVAKIKDKANASVVDGILIQIQTINAKLAQINNILFPPAPFNINLSSDTTVVEKGSIVNSINFNWTLSDTPLSQSFEGVALGAAVRSYTYTNVVSDNKTFTLSVVDPNGNTKIANSQIKFLNGIYYGVSSSVNYDSDLVKSLTKVLSDTKGRTVTVDAGPGQYIYYCIPDRLGSVTFFVGGFEGGIENVATINFTNSKGYTEKYKIYRSDNLSLGNTTINIV